MNVINCGMQTGVMTSISFWGKFTVHWKWSTCEQVLQYNVLRTNKI